DMGGDGPSMSIPREILMQMALAAPIRQARFPLNGDESTVEVPASPATDGRPATPAVRVTLSSEWKKDGRQLELTLTRKLTTETGERTMVNRDRWEIEKDGALVVRRRVETRLGSQEVKLYFRRSMS
ncbi:MAG: hypothetical protein EBZ36_13585, partial [Acidobacteria bacterium]|nr:hypothetical protein [Acidobacteriota bacterium]